MLIDYLFFNCSSIIELPDISKWNTENINNISELFEGCSSLKSLPDISNWNTKNVKYITGIFNLSVHPKNIQLISLTLFVFHLDISGNDINEEHP